MASKGKSNNKCKLLHEHIRIIGSSARLLRKAAKEIRKSNRKNRKLKQRRSRRNSVADILSESLVSGSSSSRRRRRSSRGRGRGRGRRFGSGNMLPLSSMMGPALGNSMSMMQEQYGMSPLQAARAYGGVPQGLRSF